MANSGNKVRLQKLVKEHMKTLVIVGLEAASYTVRVRRQPI